ncbi:MAG TPA: S41 family peptidase [Acidimicrobiia bacterium]|nr:S41 family peptidase [Acidimicrobiia bacterium]
MIGEIAPGIGYLGLLRVGGFASNASGSQRVLAAALDQTLRDNDAVVLDLRTATTGSEAEALLVATRFVLARTVVATSAARVPGVGSVTSGESVVNPMPTGAYPGRVVVLIGPGTAGPAELLALALEPLGAVTLIGEPSAGSPRSPLVRTLPNGWVLGVPHTEVFATDGTARVDNPLVPDLIAVVTVADLASGRDPGIAAALEVLAV